MHLLSRSSMLGGGEGRTPRRVGIISSPRAPPAPRHLFARSESIKKKKNRSAATAAAKGSKRARLAAALHELRLQAPGWSRNRKRGGAPVAAARVVGADGADADEGPSCSAVANDVPASRSGGGSAGGRGAGAGEGAGWALVALVAVLALACVVALGRAPAVCCCTCAAVWLCRGRSGVVLESPSQAGGGGAGGSNCSAARPRRRSG